MRPAPLPPWGYRLPAIALLAAFAGQSFFSSRGKSPVFDEPAHIAAGLSYLETGNFTPNRQHPPLLKELSAAFMLAGGVRWPDTAETRALASGRAGLEWAIGNSIIAGNGPGHVLFWARLPFVFLATLLGALIYFWGCELAGEAAGLGALFLYTFDPTILAHSYLVTTDVGVAAFGLLFLFALWRYVRHPAWKTLLFGGFGLGLALTAKFSAVFLLPVAALLLAASVRWPRPGASTHADVFAGLLGQAGSPSRGREYLCSMLAFFVMCLAALLVIQIVYFSPSGIAAYVDGMHAVNGDHDPNYLVFLAGQLQHRFASYFLVAYLLKEPVASIILAAMGLMAVARSQSLTMLHKLFLLVPPMFLALAYSLFADDLGIRYLIPVLPFACLAGGMAFAWLVSHAALWARLAAAALGLWVLAAAAGIYPDHLSYFNEAACMSHPARIGWDGGTRCGPEWLDDSNVDWGQSLPQLSRWMAENGRGRPLHFAYFGSFPPDAYGLPNDKDSVRDLATHGRPDSGLYAVSGHWVARLPALAARESPGTIHWLARTVPTAVAGHSIYIYDFSK
jgi:dolichyl-phosphate-mannose-protein mannosyltransferase